ncbi:MAG TPA: alpha/beta fold hydrolase [Burkholderiales bacterium]|nr:alpha/beta fold hydrolase [Burkholderiales bacterium]
MQRLRPRDDLARSVHTLPEPVLLVHGLWTNRAIMLYLSRALAGHGFAPRALGYYSALDEFEHNAARLARAIAECAGDRIHIVAHSLGGLVALRALARRPDARVRRIVLLGSPLAGCQSGRKLAHTRFLAPLLGTTRSLWTDMPQLDIPAGVEAGAVAGTRRMGLGSLVMRLPGASDGAVLVEETRHPRLADHLVMPVAHSEMLVSRAVAAQVAAFLDTGRFAA